MALADFEERFLAQPIVAIRVLNALDCQRLGLMSRETTARYLAKVQEHLAKLTDPVTPEKLDDALVDALSAWKRECLGSDNRPAVAPKDYGSFGTVCAFAGFYFSYTSVFAEAEKYLATTPLSKVAGLMSSDALHYRMTRKSVVPATQVENWIKALAAAAASGKVPLVKEWAGTVWVAPKASVTAGDATHHRDRLGLVHLPRYGKKRAVDTTLVRVEFDSKELASRVVLKRPCIFDDPGIRFRALTAAECKDGCVNPQLHGFTFTLGSATLEDGQEELTFVAEEKSRFIGWSISRLDGKLKGLHPDTDKHDDFAKHLLNRSSGARSTGAYRRPPWDLKSELAMVMGGSGIPAAGGHDVR